MTRLTVQKGHCYRRRGATGTAGEQQLAAAVADHVARLARGAGHTPQIILADDPVPDGDVFVAVHADGSTNVRARGCSFGYRADLDNAGASRLFGEVWRDEHHQAGYPGTDRPANYTAGLGRYYALDDAQRAGHDRAVVIELGFLTNQHDRAWLTANPEACARAIVNATSRVAGGHLHGHSPTSTAPPPVPAPSGPSGGLLKQGDRGTRVRQVQHLLADRGYDPGPHDGIFGPRTRQATVTFQRAQRIAVDGVVGPQTWDRLRGGLLERGSRSMTVGVLQERLSSSGVPTRSDGVFGPRTEESVRTFQGRKGLAVDGLVGRRTWGALW